MAKRKRNILGVATALQSVGESVLSDKASKFVGKALKGKRKRNTDYEIDEYGLKMPIIPDAPRPLHKYYGPNWQSRPDAAEIKKEFNKKTAARAKAQKEYKAYVEESNRIFRERQKHSNPGIEDAERLTEEWHGRPPRTEQEIVETETYEEDLAELADLEELGVLGADFSQYFISFKKNRPKLCAEDKNNLIFVGGDQRIDVDAVGVERDGKKLIPLGYCYQIVYETDKHHLQDSNGYPESYEHFFSEEFYKENFDDVDNFKTSDAWFLAMLQDGLVEEAIEKGLLPMLVYNQTDEKLILVGGKYEVTDLGIKN